MSAFGTGKYRNVFAEIGKSGEEIQKKIKDAVHTFFYGSEDERIYHPAGESLPSGDRHEPGIWGV